MHHITIIGAGLSGIYLAYLLKQEGIYAKIIEARPRIGGRIWSKSINRNTTIDLGATWVWKYQPNIIQLIQDLGLELFPQTMGNYALYQANAHMPIQNFQIPAQEPSLRVVGGTGQILEALLQNLDNTQLHLSETVASIALKEDYLHLKTDKAEYSSEYIISTLPPNLLIQTIQFSPEFPSDFINIAQNTHTWMGDSIKVGLRYPKAFWKKEDSSGTVFSQAGPVVEMYDHSNFENNLFALKGFVHPAFAQISQKERKDLIVKQLVNIFGAQALQFESYEEAIWAKEAFTFANYQQEVIPHQNNGHTIFQESYFGNRFWLAGAETSIEYAGYMSGALKSAETVFKKIMEKK